MCRIWYQKDGLLSFLDLNRVAIFIWGLGTGLYDLGLSDLYHPNLLINALAAVIVAVFCFFERTNKGDFHFLNDCFDELEIPNNKLYWILLSGVSLVAFFAFLINANAGQLRALSNNPGMVVDFKFGYLYRLTVPVSICFYLIARCTKNKQVKMVSLSLFAVFLFFTACDLSRGPIVWILTGCLLFELLWFVKRTGKTKISTRMLLLFISAFVVVLFVFDYFGSIRTASHFSNLSSHYEMNVAIPDGFTWLYIYISSPLENARYAFDNLAVTTPTLGAYLFYPFIKLASNLLGLSVPFTTWLDASTSVYSYMESTVGLTVGSFLIDAYQDFSYFGVLIYPLFYGLVSVLAKRLLSWKRLMSLTKLIVYALAIQGPLWSIFDNTVFSGPLWVCAFVMIAIDLASSFFTDFYLARRR